MERVRLVHHMEFKMQSVELTISDHARLKEHVASMPGKLDAPIHEGGK